MVKYATAQGFGDRPLGTYRAQFVELDTEYPITNKETGEEVIRWRWVFQDVRDPTTVGEMDTVTSANFRPRSNGLKFLTGMLGRTPTEDDDTDDLIGDIFDVVWGPNQNGRNTIVNVFRVIDGEAEAPLPTTLAEKRKARTLP